MSKNMSKAAPADVSGMMSNKPPSYDISAFGYQQFDLEDNFQIFANPHGVDTITEEDRVALKAY